MSKPARKIATYEDLYGVPENMTGEIIDGELVATPRPSPKHSQFVSTLGEEIGPPYRRGRGGPGGWIFLIEVEIKWESQLVVPDIAGWRKERFPPELETDWIEVVPDWVCEVFSPSTALRDRTVKKAIYGEHGVGHLWLADPIHMTIEVFRLESGRWVEAGVFGGDEKARMEPFQEIEIALDDLWLKD
ncbi:MAG: Uma2 family endonuclease [Syntrophobacteraceae bacterium]